MIKRCSLLVVLLLTAAAGRAVLGAPRAVTTAEPLSKFPATIDGWNGEDSPLDAEVVKTAAVDDYLNRGYSAGGKTLGLYVGYYQSQRQGESLHSPLQCLPGAGWQPRVSEDMDLRIGGETKRVKKLIVERGLTQLLVIYWYQTSRRVTGNEYLRKAYLVTDAFDSGRTDVALVRIIAPIGVQATADSAALELARPFAERVLPEVQSRLFRN